MRKVSVNKENVGKFLNRNATKIAVYAMFTLMIVGQVFATADAESLWNDLATTIQMWVTRLGGVVMFVGGIMFGLGWKNDDADGKTRGINTMIAGGIVIAVAALTSNFFK